jgi:hypothetical protein
MYEMAVGLMATTAGIACACFAEQMLKNRHGPHLAWRGYALVGTALVGSSLLATRVLLRMG